MDLIDKLKQISERIEKVKDQVTTEEGTKNAFIMPFIQALGYDVFNPMEVVPEYVADLGIKKGEKVDYCIMRDSEPSILIECKNISQKKLDVHKSQLHRYFHVTNAKLAILTNGHKYFFYTDLEKKNVMDDRPFLEVDMLNLTDAKVNALKQFQKSSFDIDSIVDSASQLKYTKEIRELLHQELNQPSEDFIKFILQKIYSGRITSKVIEQFTELIGNSIKALLNQMVNDRLQTAITISPSEESDEESAKGEPEDDGIDTTTEELQGFRIVQAILVQIVEANRIHHRDKKSYFGILLDDNNRKPICRLHFNGKTKYIEVFDESRNGRKEPIEKLSDIYKFSEDLLKIIDIYDDVEGSD